MTHPSSSAQVSMQGVWRAYAVRYMTQLETRPAREVYLDGHDREPPLPGLDYFFWVLVGDGRVVVVDTGMAEEEARRANRRWLGSPAQLLAGLGIRAEEVQDVIVTHAHTDHIGNLGSFPSATFWIQREEMAAATGLEMTVPSIRRFYSSAGTSELIKLLYEDRLRFLDGDGSFAPGLDYHLIGGHSRGQMALSVRTERGKILLASDAVHLYDEARDERPFFAFHDVVRMVEGYRRCLAISGGPAFLIPGHDRKVVAAYPSVGGFEGTVFDLNVSPDLNFIAKFGRDNI